VAAWLRINLQARPAAPATRRFDPKCPKLNFEVS
jgi:hypothetical protein